MAPLPPKGGFWEKTFNENDKKHNNSNADEPPLADATMPDRSVEAGNIKYFLLLIIKDQFI